MKQVLAIEKGDCVFILWFVGHAPPSIFEPQKR